MIDGGYYERKDNCKNSLCGFGAFDVGGKRVYHNFPHTGAFVNMTFISVEMENDDHLKMLEELMQGYIAETDSHSGRKTPADIIRRVSESMIAKLNEDRALRIVTEDGAPVGFFYAKVDREGDRGIVREGWGYVMEFYVSPEYRRRGLGRRMYRECEDFFRLRGARNVWLTADGVTGIPFWLSLGYTDSGEVSAENGLRIFIKSLDN